MMVVPYTAMCIGVFITACCTGFIASAVSNPFDVIKSRVMGQPVAPDGTPSLYKGVIDCCVKVSGVWSSA